MNLNTFGGSKKQGITSRVGLDNWANTSIQTYSNGYGRNKLFCMNQLGGVGAGRSMFNGRFTQTDGTHCTQPLEQLPTFDPIADEPYQRFYANRQNFYDPFKYKIHNYGIYNGMFTQVDLSFSSNVTKPFDAYHNILVNSTEQWSIGNIAPNLTAFTNAYVEVYLNTTQPAPRISVTYNNTTTVTYSTSGTFTAGSYVFYTASCPSTLVNNYDGSHQIQLSSVTGVAPLSVRSIVLTLHGTVQDLRIVNIGHEGYNNQYVSPCEWTAINYTHNRSLDTKTYSVVPISTIDAGQQLVTSYSSGTLKNNNADVSRLKDKITNGNGLRMYGLPTFTDPLDLSFYTTTTPCTLNPSSSIAMFVMVEILPLLGSVPTGCPSLVLQTSSQTYVYSTTSPLPVAGTEPYKVLLWVGSSDDIDHYPEISTRIQLTSIQGIPSQVIQTASLRMINATCKSFVILGGGISLRNMLSEPVISLTVLGTVQQSLVVPIQAATSSYPQRATVQLTNIRNNTPFGNMYTQSVVLSSVDTEVVFPMSLLYNTVNLVVDYAYVNQPNTSTTGSINNLTLLGLQLVRDGTTATGAENVLFTYTPTVSSNNLLTVNVTKFQNTNLNRIDGMNVYLDSIDPTRLVGTIQSTGSTTLNLTNFVGNWITGTKNVYFVPYRDAFVLSRVNKYEHDVINQILTKSITRI